jgi:hypothetical protein
MHNHKKTLIKGFNETKSSSLVKIGLKIKMKFQKNPLDSPKNLSKNILKEPFTCLKTLLRLKIIKNLWSKTISTFATLSFQMQCQFQEPNKEKANIKKGS